MNDKYFTIHKYALNIFKKNLKEILEKNINSDRKIIMFSTNIIAGMVVNYFEKTELNIEFVVDNAKERQGMSFFGKTVYSPEILKKEFNEQYLILIASSFQDEMIKQLEGYGYEIGTHIIKVIDLPELMNDYSYVDRTGVQPLSSDEVKKVQLEILNKIKECSQKYGIRYYLQSGTALGAVRHGGYIPWDDDVDVFVPIDDYLRLIEILKDDPQYKIVSQFNTEYYFGMGVGYMVDCNTICDINKFPIQLTTGQSIDLFPLYGIPEDAKEKEKYIIKAKELEEKCLIAIDDESRIKAINELNSFLLKYKYDECKLIGNILMPFFVKDIFPKSMFGNGVEKKFETLHLKLPEKYDEYLTHMYGDYMKLPPEDKRNGEHYYNTYYLKE